MSEVGNAFRIPMFLAAPTREGLVRLMLENNLNHGMEFRYFDISFDGKEWSVWFLERMELSGLELIRPRGRRARRSR